MKQFYLSIILALSFNFTYSQTTVYTTGQTYTDAWTGWTTPVTANVSGSSINGINIYSFSLSGGAGASYSLETSRMFSINSSDIDMYLAVTSQNATLSVEYSENNSTWTSIGSLTYGNGFAQQSLIIPTFSPGPTDFYLKIKMTGTIGSPASVQLNNLKIDADLVSESVSVTPSTTQNILISVNGTVLTANESPSAATSREWKYSTISGSGYVSFTSPETNTTYTPNFAVIGTYYVVCESTFSGNTVISDEVQINVSQTGSVQEESISNTLFYFNNTLSVVTQEKDYEVSIFNISGQLILQENNLTHYDFSNLEKGIYIVNMVSNKGEKMTRKVSNF